MRLGINMYLDDVFPKQLLTEMIDSGYVRVSEHPTESLFIYNYSDSATWDNAWNDVTLNCRGLICDDTNKIVSRPFKKFFNHSEVDASFHFDGPVTVTDKADGSLGIYYVASDGPAIATRGSFKSDQAIHATELLRSKYDGWEAPIGLTPLFEIIYPENRIVVNYGDFDDIILLCGVDLQGNRVDAANIDWPGPKIEKFEYNTYLEALAAPDRPNREGLVVFFHETGEHLKVKQEDYKILHALISTISTKAVWEAVKAKIPIIEAFAGVPDEFHSWILTEEHVIRDALCAETEKAHQQFNEILGLLPDHWERRDFALQAKSLGYDKGSVFAILDGNVDKVREICLNMVKPIYKTPGGIK